MEAFETNSDYMPLKLNNCPSWDFGHHGNGYLENENSVRMSHDVAVHIIVNPRETGQQKISERKGTSGRAITCGWCCRNKICGRVARLAVLRSNIQEKQIIVTDYTEIWTSVKIATDI